jgi:hypothetical protein
MQSTETSGSSPLISVTGKTLPLRLFFSFIRSHFRSTDIRLQSTPQQENGFDCGVFTCQFLESLSRGEETFAFSQENMPYLRRRMIWEICNRRLRDD